MSKILVIDESALLDMFQAFENRVVERLSPTLNRLSEADKKLLEIKGDLTLKKVAELLRCTPQHISNLREIFQFQSGAIKRN